MLVLDHSQNSFIAEGCHVNRILNLVGASVVDEWRQHFDVVRFELGESIEESAQRPAYVYFPIDAIISLICFLRSGASAEIAVVGYDGMLGMGSVLGGNVMAHQAVVQSAGHALRIPGQHVAHAFSNAPQARHFLGRYIQFLFSQTAQTAACNRHHLLEQQLCRWLLICTDRLHTPELVMTQELIGNMLGVRREGVASAAHALQQAGLISYKRGKISLLDRAGVLGRSCECYSAVKSLEQSLLDPRSFNATQAR